MIKRLIFCFIFTMILFNFISCPRNIPDWMLENGQEIKNYPSWTTNCNAFSEWMEWQSEDGKRLHAFVDDLIISDEYAGKFRICLRGQEIIVGFNNQNGDCIKLYNWYGDVSTWKDSVVSVEQENPDYKFIYDCYCKKLKTESNTESNKAKVEITKIDEQSFNYYQTVSGKVIIDCEFKNLSCFCDDVEKNIYTKPTEVPIKFCEYFPIDYFVEEESFLYFYPVDGSSSYKGIACNPNDLFKYIYCPEGISFREINEEKTKISFNLLDSSQSDYIDYFEIQVNSKDDVKLLFYKDENMTPILIKKLEKPDINFEWLLDSETGETKIY